MLMMQGHPTNTAIETLFCPLLPRGPGVHLDPPKAPHLDPPHFRGREGGERRREGARGGERGGPDEGLLERGARGGERGCVGAREGERGPEGPSKF